MITYAFAALLASLQSSPRDSLLAEGIRLAPMQPAEGLARFEAGLARGSAGGAARPRCEAVVARDSADVAATWRAAIALNDMAQPLRTPADRSRRDSLYARAEQYARRAVRLD